MDVVVSIGGRAALPVRAIPFLTDWEVLSPDVVAKIFAGEDARAQRLRGLQAFRLDGGAVLPMAERAWSTVSADLRELESTLAAGASAHREWRGKATELLPTGVFVWRDEFERSYEREYGKDGRTRWNLPEEEDSRRLDFSPFVPPELQQLVMEGFDRSPVGRPDEVGALPQAAPARMTDERLLERFKELGGKFDAEGNPSGGRRGALAALKNEDGRHRKTVTERLKRAHAATRGGIGGMARALTRGN